jgi:hypothetical protein
MCHVPCALWCGGACGQVNFRDLPEKRRTLSETDCEHFMRTQPPRTKYMARPLPPLPPSLCPAPLTHTRPFAWLWRVARWRWAVAGVFAEERLWPAPSLQLSEYAVSQTQAQQVLGAVRGVYLQTFAAADPPLLCLLPVVCVCVLVWCKR